MPEKDQSFWISYSDLSTGLMMVFLLVTTIFALKQLMAERDKRIEVERLVNDVSELTTMRLRLAERLQKEFADVEHVEVNPVSAQVTVNHKALEFDSGKAEPKKLDFLRSFVHPYACALMSFELQQCEQGCGGDDDPLENSHCYKQCAVHDPRMARSIKRVLVTGHADLESKSRGLAAHVDNRDLSGDRATNVINAMFDIAGESVCSGEGEDLLLRRGIGGTRPFLQARMHPAAGGELKHCVEALHGDTSRLCSSLDDRPRVDDYRTVTFEVELVGEDLSGMALNLVALDATVSGSASTADLIRDLRPMLYACVREKEPSLKCEPVLAGSDALRRSEPLRRAVADACAAAREDDEASPEYCQQR